MQLQSSWEYRALGSSRVLGNTQLSPLCLGSAVHLPLCSSTTTTFQNKQRTPCSVAHHFCLPGSLHVAVHGTGGPGQAFTGSPVQVTSPCPQGQLSQGGPGSCPGSSVPRGAPRAPLPMEGLPGHCHRAQTPLKPVCHWLLDSSRHCAAGKNTAAIKGGSLLAGIL